METSDPPPIGTDGFVPDPEAWARYGALVEGTRRAVEAEAAKAPPLAIPQQARRLETNVSPPHARGYEARGSGDLCDLIVELRSGETSATTEVERSLTQAENKDTALHAVVALERERALAAAQRLDALSPEERGPLAGAPYARKDLFHRIGFATECGSLLFKDQMSTTSATVLDRLDAAGGIDIGRLSMAELAMSPTGFNAHEAHPRNPWNTSHVSGGSSSGSGVAVSAGYVRAALGTDTGGSVRHPAAMCGVTGLKPTENRTSRAGVWPLSWSLDCVGPLAPSARDCAVLLEIMSGPDAEDTAVSASAFKRPDLTGDLTGVRIGVPQGYYFNTVTPRISEALEQAKADLTAAGAEVVETGTPNMATVNAMAHLVLAAEASAQLGHHFRDPGCKIGRQVRDRLEPGMFYSAPAYAAALRLRPQIRSAWLAAAMADCDAVFTPAIPREVPTIAETTQGEARDISSVIASVTHATRGVNYLGLPALSVPCGFDGNGLPIAFQLIGQPDQEATLIRIGDAYQQVTDWHTRRPPERTP